MPSRSVLVDTHPVTRGRGGAASGTSSPFLCPKQLADGKSDRSRPPALPRHNLRLWLRPALDKHIYDRIDWRQNLSLGEVRLDTALVGPRKAFAKCSQHKLNSVCSSTRLLSRCELHAAPPTCVGYACRLGVPIERRVKGCLVRFFHRLLGILTFSAVGDRQQPKTFRGHCKLRKRLDLKFLHHIVPMHLDGSFRCAQRISDLLVRLAANQLREDFLLTRCKAGKKRAQCGHPSVLLSNFIVPDEGAPDRLQQFLFQYRFDKEVFCARLDRLHRHRNVAMTGYEDDGQPASEHCELILQLRSAQAGHLHIQQNTAAIPARQCLQELLGRLIERNSIAAGP